MMSPAAISVIVLLSITYAESSPFKMNSRKIYDVTLNLETTNDDIENATVEIVRTPEARKIFDVSKENTTKCLNQIKQKKINSYRTVTLNVDALKDKIENKRIVEKTRIPEEVINVDIYKNNLTKRINENNATLEEHSNLKDDVEISKEKVNVDVPETNNNIYRATPIQSGNGNLKPDETNNWKHRVKRDDDEDLIIWDNCPGKLQYELIDGELKCVVPSDSPGLSNRLLGPLSKCPTGTRRAILPGGSHMCLQKRSRRT